MDVEGVIVFDIFKSRKSPVRQRLKDVYAVRRTWFEWSLDDGNKVPTLVVEVDCETDPRHPDFWPDALDEIWSAVQAVSVQEATPAPRVRVMPRVFDS